MSDPLPYVIFEVANTHGGDARVLERLIDTFGTFQWDSKGIKFQPFKYDRIALPDYPWYGVYKELYFSTAQWADLVRRASAHGDVWLDIFDDHGTDVLALCRAQVHGIKLQASVLENQALLASLRAIGLEGLRLMINVSGFDIAAIEGHLKGFADLAPEECILQIGFQSYPTRVEDTGLQKIAVLRAAFPGIPICLADHLDATAASSRWMPALGHSLGCNMVEKHYCLERATAKYDHHASLEPNEVEEMLQNLRDAGSATSGVFISPSEQAYLSGTIQVPVAQVALRPGSLVHGGQVRYARTAQTGLSWAQVQLMQRSRMVLDRTVAPGSTIPRDAYRKARIAVVVACRMKSTRLRNKAILPLDGVPSVERCLSSCLRIGSADRVILATSTLEEDAVLAGHTLGDQVDLWKGDPDDVIARYLGACDRHNVDVVVRVTADCPLVSWEIAEQLLESHFATGADYTAPRQYAVGTNSEVYNVEALRRVIELKGNAPYSEYMTWYMQNNPDIFKVNMVDLAPDLVRPYRLTLDHPEDLDMLDRLYRALREQGLEPTIKNAFEVLDGDPDLAAINAGISLVYRTDEALIAKLDRETRITPA